MNEFTINLFTINNYKMELLRVIREESGDFPKFESALAKTPADEITKPI